jgi:error-prone DNA polymerase
LRFAKFKATSVPKKAIATCIKMMFLNIKGIKFIIVPPAVLNSQFDFDDDFKTDLKPTTRLLAAILYIAASRSYSGDDAKRVYRLAGWVCQW